MRLICPNCGAQYEVDSSVIPAGGRDVQCSGCGHTWFQRAAGSGDEDMAQELAEDVIFAPEAEGGAVSASASGDVAVEETIIKEIVVEEIALEEIGDEAPTAPPEAAKEGAAGHHLDEAVLDILRQEAAAETTARSHDSGALETQPDLGLEQTADGSAAIRERTARLRGIEPAQPASGSGARSDLLPDIEEINSTLRAASERTISDDEAGPQEVASAQSGRRGFRLGLGLVLLVVALALVAYIYAPLIVEKLPATRPAMTIYVAYVDGARLWLDGRMKQAITMMSGNGKTPG